MLILIYIKICLGDKVYNRQFSAPILKRKTSQFITPILSILPGKIKMYNYNTNKFIYILFRSFLWNGFS